MKCWGEFLVSPSDTEHTRTKMIYDTEWQQYITHIDKYLIDIHNKNQAIADSIQINLTNADTLKVWSYIIIDWVAKRVAIILYNEWDEYCVQTWYWSYHVRDDGSCSFSWSPDNSITFKLIERYKWGQSGNCRFFSRKEMRWQNGVDLKLLFPSWTVEIVNKW